MTWLDRGTPGVLPVGGDANVYHFVACAAPFSLAPLTGLTLGSRATSGLPSRSGRCHRGPLGCTCRPGGCLLSASERRDLLLQPAPAPDGVLLAGAAWLAPAVKVYAFVPMVGEARWRDIAAGLAIFAATVLSAPTLWSNWATSFVDTNARLLAEAQGGWSLSGPLLMTRSDRARRDCASARTPDRRLAACAGDLASSEFCGAIVASLLAPAIGEQLAVAPPRTAARRLHLADGRRLEGTNGRRSAGSLSGVMAAAKLTPASLVGWLVGGGRWGALAGFAGTL